MAKAIPLRAAASHHQTNMDHGLAVRSAQLCGGAEHPQNPLQDPQLDPQPSKCDPPPPSPSLRGSHPDLHRCQ